jgi:hypothetical protein
LSSEQPDITSFATGLSERDVQLIRAIEWLTFVPDAARDALVKSNDVARYFLGTSDALSCPEPEYAEPLSIEQSVRHCSGPGSDPS